ncbi:tetratricopeptide repeat protein [Radiobacillus deserti]|uniref:Tetratricopeptide repeat protein n=1 Tax=Radiobacillus deserti TaxID=2594883 RepID=A0A516KKQ2_9BACI|nr:tetratricopeptide repeat protein [Radiobacillus deserti]QDP41965.1 tetratricopeptide repeat protein [Radiobacillus deserti]
MGKKSITATILIFLFIIGGIVTINLLDNSTSQAESDNSERDIKKIEKYLEDNEDDTSAILELGVRYFREGKFEQSIEQYNRVIDIEPENPLAWHRLANSYVYMGEYEKAYSARKKVVEYDPNAASYMYLSTLDVLYDSSTALTNSKKALDLARKNPDQEDVKSYEKWVNSLTKFNEQQASGDIGNSYLTLIKSDKTFEKPLLLEFVKTALEDPSTNDGLIKKELETLTQKIKAFEGNLISYSMLN